MESLDPRGKLDFRVNLVRKDQQAPLERRVRRVTKERQAYQGRKEDKDQRDLQAPPDKLAYREKLDRLAHPVRLDPKGPVVQGVRKGAMEDADHPGLVDLREFRAFLDPED